MAGKPPFTSWTSQTSIIHCRVNKNAAMDVSSLIPRLALYPAFVMSETHSFWRQCGLTHKSQKLKYYLWSLAKKFLPSINMHTYFILSLS